MNSKINFMLSDNSLNPLSHPDLRKNELNNKLNCNFSSKYHITWNEYFYVRQSTFHFTKFNQGEIESPVDVQSIYSTVLHSYITSIEESEIIRRPSGY